MKKVKSFLAVAMIATMGFLVSCENENPSPMGTVNLKFAASGIDIANSGGRTAAAIEITDFQISIRDVILITDQDDSTEVAFRGPYQLDLLNGSDAVSETIGSAIVPNGVYKELRFKFHKDEDLSPSEPLFDRSIFIAGTIGDKPFELWHDTSENFDIGKSTGIVVNDNVVNLTVNFTINQFLNSHTIIDLSQAVDGNEDGLIEINTNDPDGNKEIVDALKENIKISADLLEE